MQTDYIINNFGLIHRTRLAFCSILSLRIILFLFCLVGSHTWIKAQCHPDDFAALKALYNSTNGDNWTDTTGWTVIKNETTCPVGYDLEDAFGVALNGDHRVDFLNLFNNNLDGNIPIELSQLSNLTYLFLSDNSLSGSIPVELGELSNLITLSLSDNSLSGSIPVELGELSNLTTLNLYSNSLTGSIPVELGELTNLTTLNLSDNSLSGSIPVELGELINLTTLYLSDNSLTGSIPVELGELTNLTILDLSDNSLIGNIPAAIGNLNKLLVFQIQSNELSGCYPPNLKKLCGQLIGAFIELGNDFDATWSDFCAYDAGICACDDEDFAALKALYNSTNGDNWTDTMGWTMIRDSLTCPMGFDLSTVYGLGLDPVYGRVDSIRLRDNGLTGVLNDSIGMLSHLRTLNLSKNSISSFIPDELGNIPTLEDLRLHENSMVGAIKTDGFPVLRVYSVNDNNLSGGIPGELAQLDSLRELWLSDNSLSVSSVGIDLPYELGFIEELTVLRIDGNGLDGCFPTNWQGLCTQLTNVNIDAGNSFDADWADFCTNGSGACNDCNITPKYWSGVDNDNWNNPSNWVYGCVPEVGDEVYVTVTDSINIPQHTDVEILALHIVDSMTYFHIEEHACLTLHGEMSNISNAGTFISHGHIQMDSSDMGFVNVGNFINYGSVSMDQTMGGNLVNFGKMVNTTTGLISVTSSSTEEVRPGYSDIFFPAAINNGVLTREKILVPEIADSLVFHNYGEISIDSAQIAAVANSAYFFNHHIIQLSNNVSTGILNSGTFENGVTGLITISKTGCPGGEEGDVNASIMTDIRRSKSNYEECEDGTGISNTSVFRDTMPNIVFTNRGTIDIVKAGVGILNEDQFDNYGMLVIDTVEIGIDIEGVVSNYNYGMIDISYAERGIMVGEGDTLYNRGVIAIDTVDNYAILVTEQGVFTNIGMCSIDSSDGEGIQLWYGTLNNYDTIEISRAGGDALDLVLVDGSSTVNNHGYIHIGDSNSGIRVTDGPNVLNNYNNILIHDITDNGIYIGYDSHLLNQDSIGISDVGSSGLYVVSASVDNQKYINIAGAGDHGLCLDLEADYTNGVTAELIISNCQHAALKLIDHSHFEHMEGASFIISNSFSDLLDIGINCTFDGYPTIDIQD